LYTGEKITRHYKEEKMGELIFENLGKVKEFEKQTEFLKEAYRKITTHWRNLLPEFKVIIVSKPLNKIPELKEYVDEMNKRRKENKEYMGPGFWKAYRVLATNDKKDLKIFARIQDYIHYAIDDGEKYYFQKDFLEIIAGILIAYSPNLAKVALKNATGYAEDSIDLAAIAFKSSFSRFFINKEYLADKKPDALAFMKRLDKLARAGKIETCTLN
jgi:hypothetical protein